MTDKKEEPKNESAFVRRYSQIDIIPALWNPTICYREQSFNSKDCYQQQHGHLLYYYGGEVSLF